MGQTFYTRFDDDGNAITTECAPPAAAVQAGRGANNLFNQLLGLAAVVAAIALMTLLAYQNGYLAGPMAWLEARGGAITSPIPQENATEQPVALPTAPVVQPPIAPEAAAIEQVIEEQLTPQEHAPFYEWELSRAGAALLPLPAAQMPAFASQAELEAYLQAHPELLANQADNGGPAVSPEPATSDDTEVEAVVAPAIIIPTTVPISQRGPVAGGQGSRGYNPAPMPSIPPHAAAPIVPQPQTPFYGYEMPAPPPPAAPNYVAPQDAGLVPQAAMPPGCILDPACVAAYQ